MKILENNAGKKQKPRYAWCTKCNSKLELTDADIPAGGMVKCPACKQRFKAMTEAEAVEAYYQK